MKEFWGSNCTFNFTCQKSEERVLKNWRRLIRGKRLLEQMRERFK